MTDRFRYLPCVHDALAVPDWWTIGAPYKLGDRLVRGGWEEPMIDLSHPAGWDHAVRALFAILSVPVEPSTSLSFYAYRIECAPVAGIRANGHKAGTDDHADLIDRAVAACEARSPADLRREALCRCICTALRLDVDVVFPVERT